MNLSDILIMENKESKLMEFIEQANDIIKHNGRCPSNTICSYCVISNIGEIKNCNPSYAIELCKKMLGE